MNLENIKTAKELNKYCLLEDAEAISGPRGDNVIHLTYLFMQKHWNHKDIRIINNIVHLIFDDDTKIFISKEYYPNIMTGIPTYQLNLYYLGKEMDKAGKMGKMFEHEYDGTLEGAYTALILLDDDLNEYFVEKEIDDAFNSKYNPKPEVKIPTCNIDLDF